MKLERFSSESCPMNKRNSAMVKAVNDLCDEIKAKIVECYDIDEIRDVVAEHRPILLQRLQEIIDYNSVDYVVLDENSHIVVDPVLPGWFFAITNPRHMAWTDKELTKEFTEQGLVVRDTKSVRRWDE